ncbi:MAG: hypothetical protein ACK5N9_21535, partial [Pirellula sp.]
MQTRNQFENQALDRRARFLGPDLCRDFLSPIGQCRRSSFQESTPQWKCIANTTQPCGRGPLRLGGGTAFSTAMQSVFGLHR